MKVLQIVSIVLVILSVLLFFAHGALDLIYDFEIAETPEKDAREILCWTGVALCGLSVAGIVVSGRALNKREKEDKDAQPAEENGQESIEDQQNEEEIQLANEDCTFEQENQPKQD